MKWVRLTTAPNAMMAEMWSELLRNDGVPAFAKNPDGVSVAYGLPSLAGCWVLVPEDRRDEAAKILTESTDGEAQIEPP